MKIAPAERLRNARLTSSTPPSRNRPAVPDEDEPTMFEVLRTVPQDRLR